jgi:uncharacterized phage protein (TIGR02218 family)
MFEDNEESRYAGHPITLYYFRYGSAPANYIAWTDNEETITYAGVDYLPHPIQRNAVNASGTLDKSDLTIQVPHDSALTELFRVWPPSQVVTLTISQGHLDDDDNEFLVIWKGRVLSVNREITQATLTCQAMATALRRSGLRRNYQYGCPHVLYGTHCKANKAAATVTATISAINGNVLDFVPGWTVVDQMKYINGTVSWTDASGVNHIRSMISHAVLDQYGLNGLPQNLSVGDTVEVTLGCNRQMDDCSAVHNNINNFGGQPWIPTKNPIGIFNHFY